MEILKINRQFKDNHRIYALNELVFPEEERIPSHKLYYFIEQFHCDTYAFYETAEFIGYTIIMISKEDRIGYLWYLAITPEKQNQGYGSQSLQKLAALYPEYTIVLDMEQVDKTCDNPMQRQKRLNFYLRNGYTRTYMGMSYFGVDYELLCNRESFDIHDFQKMINRTKGTNWNPVFSSLLQ